MASRSSSIWVFLCINFSILYRCFCKSSSQMNTEWFNYTQKLNHFGMEGFYGNTTTFPQRVIVDPTYWAGSKKNGPILVLLGEESPISGSIGQIGIINKAAPRFRAMVVYIEHRFYGTSVPLGSIDEALFDPIVRSYLSTQQALADFAEIITSLKANLSANNSPVIVVGGSYSGILAAWFRLKYPQIAIGALASSAPVFFYEQAPPENDFCAVVTRDFEQINQQCADIIRQSWRMIDEIASSTNGLAILYKTFNLCRPPISSYELKYLLVRLYSFAAQYNGRFNNWINSICDPIVEASNGNILEGVARAINGVKSEPCVRLESTVFAPPLDDLDADSQRAWDWQTCSELDMNDSCSGDNSILPQNVVFDGNVNFRESCWLRYIITPDPSGVRRFYGRQDIQAGSNIIFSNGLMDPLSSIGIVEDVSDTIVAVTTQQGSHCLDLSPVRKDDPKWLKRQREKEIRIMGNWINHSASKTTFPRSISTIHVFTMLVLLGYIL